MDEGGESDRKNWYESDLGLLLHGFSTLKPLFGHEHPLSARTCGNQLLNKVVVVLQYIPCRLGLPFLKKNLIERAYLVGERLGLAVCCQDEAGPYHTIAYPATRWQMQGDPRRVDPHFERNGVTTFLTLFRPATGEVRVKGVSQTTNAIIHRLSQRPGESDPRHAA